MTGNNDVKPKAFTFFGLTLLYDNFPIIYMVTSILTLLDQEKQCYSGLKLSLSYVYISIHHVHAGHKSNFATKWLT